MPLLALLSAAMLTVAPADTTATLASATPAIDPRLVLAPDDTVKRPRRRAVEYSDWYARRLTIHRYASYTMPPLFVAEYVLGDKLLKEKRDAFAGRRFGTDDNLRNTHTAVGIGVGALFALNTVTGVWNLVESRSAEDGRKQRIAHSVLMLASDAGFAATGLVAGNAKSGNSHDAELHRNIALGSMAIATVGTTMMWFFRH